MIDSVDRLLDELRQTGRELPEELREAAGELASQALVDGLVAIMRDDELRHDHPKKAGPPVHAAALLGHLGTERALRSLAEQVAAEGRATSLGETAEEHLQAWDSDAARDALVAVYRDRADALGRKRIAFCLAGFSTFDREVADILVAVLEHASGREQSELLVALGATAPDEIAPALSDWFADASLAPARIPDREIIRTAAETIRKLGGTLDDAHRELLEATKL